MRANVQVTRSSQYCGTKGHNKQFKWELCNLETIVGDNTDVVKVDLELSIIPDSHFDWIMWHFYWWGSNIALYEYF